MAVAPVPKAIGTHLGRRPNSLLGGPGMGLSCCIAAFGKFRAFPGPALADHPPVNFVGAQENQASMPIKGFALTLDTGAFAHQPRGQSFLRGLAAGLLDFRGINPGKPNFDFLFFGWIGEGRAGVPVVARLNHHLKNFRGFLTLGASGFGPSSARRGQAQNDDGLKKGFGSVVHRSTRRSTVVCAPVRMFCLCACARVCAR